MAKILDKSYISGTVPKIMELPDAFSINGQMYDKLTLEPKKLKSLILSTSHPRLYMNTSAILNYKISGEMYSDNNCITDKYDPKVSYLLISEASTIKIVKCSTDKNDTTIVNSSNVTHEDSMFNFFCQDASYLYGTIVIGTACSSYIFRINKEKLSIELCNVGNSYSKISILKEEGIFIYYVVIREFNKFIIGKYNKSNNTNTEIYSDMGTIAFGTYSISEIMKISDNEFISIRNNSLFEQETKKTQILKKYIIDYKTDKVYSMKLDLDCSILPDECIPLFSTYTAYTQLNYFNVNNATYIYIYSRDFKVLYLGKKISDTKYAIIQEYQMPKTYTGMIPYDNGKVLIFFDNNNVDFISFSEFEERYELTNSLSGSFASFGIDRNKVMWLQHSTSEVENISISIPTSSNAEFENNMMEYTNSDIETFLNVYSKNFNGALVESNVEVVLFGPVVFSDTGNQSKKIKTNANAISKIPITIKSSGIIEASVFII